MNLYIFMFSLCAVPLFMLMGIMGSVATRAQLQLTKSPHRWQISLMFYWYVWVVTTSASRDSTYLLHPYQHQWNDNAICMNKIQSFSPSKSKNILHFFWCYFRQWNKFIHSLTSLLAAPWNTALRRVHSNTVHRRIEIFIFQDNLVFRRDHSFCTNNWPSQPQFIRFVTQTYTVVLHLYVIRM